MIIKKARKSLIRYDTHDRLYFNHCRERIYFEYIMRIKDNPWCKYPEIVQQFDGVYELGRHDLLCIKLVDDCEYVQMYYVSEQV